MRLKLRFLPLFLALLAPAALLAADPHSQQAARAPVLLAEINNNGDVRLTLTVYNDGEAILARKDPDEPDGEICSALMPADDVEALANTLHEAGALHLPNADPVSNTSRKTISFFIGPDQPARTRGNTFSYYRAEGPYLDVALAINEVIIHHFGGCI
jgi:hypothetical protein